MGTSWGVSGLYSATYTNSQSVSGRDSETINNQMILSDSGSIWKNWLGRWDASLGFSWGETSLNSEKQSNSDSLQGKVNISLFPISHFPISLFYTSVDVRQQNFLSLEESSSIFTDDSSRVSSGSITKRYGLNYSYRPPGSAWFYSLGVINALAADLVSLEEAKSLSVLTSATKIIGDDDLSHNLDYDRYVSDIGSLETEKLILGSIYAAELSPLSRYSVSYNGNYNSSEQEGVRQNESLAHALSAQIHDRSVDSKVVRGANISVTSSTLSGVGLSEKISVSTAEISGQLSYRISNEMGISSSLSIESSTQGISLLTESLGFGYSPEGYNFELFDYSWNSGFNLVNSNNSEGDGDSVLVGNFSHALRRTLLFSDVDSLTMELNQSFVDIAASNKSRSRSLNGSITVGWLHLNGFSQTNSSITLSDAVADSSSPGAGRIISSNQSMTAKVGYISTFGAAESISIDWNVNVSREENLTRSVTDFIGNYTNGRFANVSHLSYFSSFSFRPAEIPSLSEISTVPYTLVWRNKWGYGIGLLSLGFSINLTSSSEVSGVNQLYLVNFSRVF